MFRKKARAQPEKKSSWNNLISNSAYVINATEYFAIHGVAFSNGNQELDLHST